MYKRQEYEVDSLTKLKELLQVQHDTGMANARAALANAEEDLRVTLRNIAAVQNLFTVGERTVFANVLGRYEAAFNAYNEQLNVEMCIRDRYDMYWHSVENSVYTERLYNKYASLIDASNVLNKVEQQRMMIDNNVLSSVDFVLSPLGIERRCV